MPAFDVFISYSHRDKELRDELERHLSNLKRQDVISSWYDGDIAPGAEWEPEILQRLKFAQIILLLISADFIHSDFCYSIEMKQAIDRHHAREVHVIPHFAAPHRLAGRAFRKTEDVAHRCESRHQLAFPRRCFFGCGARNSKSNR